MAQGQGDGTRVKEDNFGQLFRQSLRISKAGPVAHQPYWHIEPNAGTGWNSKAGCDGSPLVFCRAAMEVERYGQVIGYFCDRDPKAIEQLRRRLVGWKGLQVHFRAMDNAEFLREVAGIIRRTETRPPLALGTCLCDPNGWHGLPVDALAEFTVEFRRIDIILNINCTLFRTVKGCCRELAKVSEGHKKAFRCWPEPAEIIERMHKKYWLISNVGRTQGHKFLQLIGRNTSAGWKRFGRFFPLNSWEGRTLLNELKRIEPDQKCLPGMEDAR